MLNIFDCDLRFNAHIFKWIIEREKKNIFVTEIEFFWCFVECEIFESEYFQNVPVLAINLIIFF